MGCGLSTEWSNHQTIQKAGNVVHPYAGLLAQPPIQHLDRPGHGKPTDNAFAESFNGKVRAECLNTVWFLSLDDARRKCETWRRDYNEERPHNAIGDKCPIELMNGAGPHGPPGA